MAPFGIWQAYFGDRLGLKRPHGSSYWHNRSTRDRVLDDARKQF